MLQWLRRGGANFRKHSFSGRENVSLSSLSSAIATDVRFRNSDDYAPARSSLRRQSYNSDTDTNSHDIATMPPKGIKQRAPAAEPNYARSVVQGLMSPDNRSVVTAIGLFAVSALFQDNNLSTSSDSPCDQRNMCMALHR